MSHSTHVGFNCLLMCVPSRCALLRLFVPPEESRFDDVGVGCRATAVCNDRPLLSRSGFVALAKSGPDSDARGVGHRLRLAIVSNDGRSGPSGFCPPLFRPYDRAAGVGYSVTKSVSVRLLGWEVHSSVQTVAFRDPFASVAVGVGTGDNEEPLSDVGRAHLERREQSCRNSITHRSKVIVDLAESHS